MSNYQEEWDAYYSEHFEERKKNSKRIDNIQIFWAEDATTFCNDTEEIIDWQWLDDGVFRLCLERATYFFRDTREVRIIYEDDEE